MDEFTLNVGYAGIYVRTLPTTGTNGDVVIIKQGFVYKWEKDKWVRVDTTLEFLFLNTKRQQLLLNIKKYNILIQLNRNV